MTAPLSTLRITPRGTTARGAVSNAEPTGLQPPGIAASQALQRASQPGYFQWLDHVRAASGCTRPIRLVGDIYTARRTGPGTAEILDIRHTDQLPDTTIYKACGNRRASVCPACARTYQNDAYQILRAFLIGGKGVPDTVAQHPAVFATFTAPGFGLVHTRKVKQHTCTNRKRCDCRAEPCRARTHGDTGLCPHGNPTVCFTRHDRADKTLGKPFCLDCYDHPHQVVWNLFSTQLWHRTKEAIERYLQQLAKRRGIPRVQVLTSTGKVRSVPPVRVAHGKAAEFQTRGVVHFHALLRIDGVDPTDSAAAVPPPAGFSSLDLEDAIYHAVTHIDLTTPTHPDQPEGWYIQWGDPDKGIDVKHITLGGTLDVTDGMAAGYLAKYSTKSTEATGHRSTRLTAETINERADPDGDHNARLIDACWQLGRLTDTPVPVPLRQRPTPPRRATALEAPWTCPNCGRHTRLRVCPTCEPTPQPKLDTKPANDGDPNPYLRLRRWAHMLGFGGHFLTKARRGCPTFTLLRTNRVTHRRQHDDDQAPGLIRTADHTDEETILIVGIFDFAGVGWHNTGDALLANTSAAMARARHDAAREELTHEIGSTPAISSHAA
ncbi:replication initiator [Rugosimonospora africana]|uniref:Plasmid replication initiator protein n=1 Tax=Rugosimonospora africana TaxID=556532 RepID=A0A8J3VQ65_9ACTN|nr:replication initiator [Rugosimonospora africana]GIH14697.1 hypothetical protein Raf01_28690 [Rugosimonospora africana]